MNKKKVFLKFAEYFYFSTAMLFLFTIPVHAYIDPSVVTYGIQAIAGIAIALGTFFGVYWRKIRRMLIKNSDAGKNSDEPDYLIFSDPQSDSPRILGTPVSVSAQEKPAAKKQHGLSAAVWLSAALSFMLCLYAPLEIYFTNISEFEYDIYAFYKYILLLFAAAAVIIALLYFIACKLNKKFFTLCLLIGFICFMAFYIQGNFLTGDLPPTDGREVDWSMYHKQEMQSLILWIAVAAASVLALIILKKDKFYTVVRLLSAGIAGILLITLVTLGFRNNGFRHKSQIFPGISNMNVMSDDQNFVIFVADALDSKAFRYLLETSDPEYAEYFEDFTYYPDTLAMYPYTKLAVPQIITGIPYECQAEFEQYYKNSTRDSVFLNRLDALGYINGIYDMQDVLFDDPFIQKSENVVEAPYGIRDPKVFLADELRMSFFLYMPYQLKKYEPYALFNLTNQKPAREHYDWHDDIIYDYLRNTEFTTAPEKRFRYIHIEGAHPPYQYDKNVNDVEDTPAASYEGNVQAAVTIIHTYLENLKKINAYDNSIIIFMADHGYADDNHSKNRYNPILMIKGLNESHEFNISDKPVSYESLESIYLNLLDGASGDSAVEDPRTHGTVVRRYFNHDFYNLGELFEFTVTDKTAAEPKIESEQSRVLTLAN